ncbi:oxygenase MpaB family protein [Pseudonocardia sp. CA-107938]|uniref:oxygenase MpaB family protein n=1 Tax=Pseudonocardia sp. CA-107938 TaxID=3240021 RepID=UPI003D89CB64
MTCPVSARQDDEHPHAAVLERFERVGGSLFLGLFSVGLFDQPMLPPVSAALEATGRIREQPWARAIRTAAADQLIYLGTDEERAAESRRLVELHRDVRGTAPGGLRYSALTPQNWNWILYSTFFVQRGAYLAVTGDVPSPAADQAIWDRFRALAEGLQLPGRSRLIEDYQELVAYYDRTAVEELQQTATLAAATASVRRPPRPDFWPAVAAPAWRLASPIASRVVTVLGCGIMHPAVRARMPVRWSPRHDVEFRLLTRMLQVAFRVLPSVLTDTPLARNRRQYRKLVRRYQGVGLTSFAPDSAGQDADRRRHDHGVVQERQHAVEDHLGA